MEALFNQYEQDKPVGHVLIIKLKGRTLMSFRSRPDPIVTKLYTENTTEEQKDEIVRTFKSWESEAPEDLYEVRIGKHIKPAYDITKAKVVVHFPLYLKL